MATNTELAENTPWPTSVINQINSLANRELGIYLALSHLIHSAGDAGVWPEDRAPLLDELSSIKKQLAVLWPLRRQEKMRAETHAEMLAELREKQQQPLRSRKRKSRARKGLDTDGTNVI